MELAQKNCGPVAGWSSDGSVRAGSRTQWPGLRSRSSNGTCSPLLTPCAATMGASAYLRELHHGLAFRALLGACCSIMTTGGTPRARRRRPFGFGNGLRRQTCDDE
jgi:hypothetical protein